MTLLKALADMSRLQIIEFLQEGEKSSKDIEAALGKCQSTTSQHLKVLVDSGLLAYRQDGIRKFYTIKSNQVLDIIAAITSLVGTLNKANLNNMAAHDIRDTLL
jgi:DNA-binding transcriptional ArsR family regulator